MSLLATTIGASAVNTAANYALQEHQVGLQKELLQNQYDQYFSAARRAGATPAAIAEGLTKSGAANAPSVSAPNPVPDLASNMISAADVEGMNARRAKENEETEQNLLYNPFRWRADVMQAYSQVYKNFKSAGLDQSMSDWYQSSRKSLDQKRPYEILGLKAGLVKMLAEYNKILAETKESKSRTNLNYSQIGLNQKLGNYYDSASYNQMAQGNLAYSQSFNEDLKGFALQFENMLRANNFNPSDTTFENLKRWSLTDPDRFKQGSDMLIQTGSVVDEKLKDILGKNYKFWMKAAAAGYLFNKYRPRFLPKFESLTRSVGNLIPLAHPAPDMSGAISPSAGFDLLLRD